MLKKRFFSELHIIKIRNFLLASVKYKKCTQELEEYAFFILNIVSENNSDSATEKNLADTLYVKKITLKTEHERYKKL